MKTELAFSALMICCYSVYSQEETKELSHDIGFNTNIIFNGLFNSSGGSYNFVYKRQVAPNKAMRYGTSFSVLATTQPSSNYYSLNSTSSISLSIGKEWQHAVAKKWIWYNGFDLKPNFYMNTYENSNANGGSLYKSSSESKTYGVTFTPLLGLRFIISEKLYVATEASLNFGLSHQSYYSDYTQAGVTTVQQNYSTNSLQASTSSGGGVFVFYRF